MTTEAPIMDRRQAEGMSTLELWIRRDLKSKWGHVTREALPASLLALLDEKAAPH